MSTRVLPSTQLRLPPWAVGVAAVVALVALAGLGYGTLRLTGVLSAPTATPTDPHAGEPEGEGVVHFAESKWPAASIRLEPAARAEFTERAWRSGHLGLNETRIAHISPAVEGIVREVKVRLGQDVKAGEVLAVLDCREVGQAKLELVKSRLAAGFARTQFDWTKGTGQAANELVEAMTSGASVAEIEKRFKDRAIGELRQQLVTAYSRRLQAKAHFDAIGPADVQGALSQANVTRLRADYEAAEASFRALCEEVKFQTGQQTRAAEQKLREAQTAESLGKATLMMFGFSREEVEAMDPIVEGPAVSHYPVRAPFAGTVIEQHAVLAERIGPQVQLFQMADLSTLWLKADVQPRDLALARFPVGSKLRFRLTGEEETRDAEVFYAGDVVDSATRTISLTAAVPNPSRLLKPGLFAEVELVGHGGTCVQVPASAVQREGTQAFVFVHAGGDAFRRVDVKVGRNSGGVVEVVSGLAGGEPVVTSGGFVLKSELFKDQMVGE
jgi:RND family efflux transporter MFP subunit